MTKKIPVTSRAPRYQVVITVWRNLPEDIAKARKEYPNVSDEQALIGIFRDENASTLLALPNLEDNRRGRIMKPSLTIKTFRS